MNRKKLPLSKILINAFLIPWSRKGHFLQTIALPTLLLVSIWGIWATINPTGILLSYFLLFTYLVAFSYFAITCHRLILTDNASISQTQEFNIKRMTWFLLWLIFFYGLYLIIELATMNLFINLIDTPAPLELNEAAIEQHQLEIQQTVDTLRNLVYLPIMYILGRFSLVFPATAIDKKTSFIRSWIQTRHNGLRIIFIIALFPWALEILLSILTRENATIFEQGIVGILMYLSFAIGIFALSLTYLELQDTSHQELF